MPEGIRLVCDESLRESKQWACGANEVDYHFTGACPERDFTVDEWADLVTVVAGDPCPHCGKPLSAARGIEVSQVFQLGTKYSEAMGATFMDEDGKEKPLIMGCYGVVCPARLLPSWSSTTTNTASSGRSPLLRTRSQ